VYEWESHYEIADAAVALCLQLMNKLVVKASDTFFTILVASIENGYRGMDPSEIARKKFWCFKLVSH
jgi:hypothetical protein